MAVDLGQILGQAGNQRKRKNRIRDPLTGSGGLGSGIGPTGGGMGGKSSTASGGTQVKILSGLAEQGMLGSGAKKYVGSPAGKAAMGKILALFGAAAASDLNLKINIKTINNALSQFR
jgi:hypothetical protein